MSVPDPFEEEDKRLRDFIRGAGDTPAARRMTFDETARKIAEDVPFTLGMVRLVLEAVKTEQRTRAVLDFAARANGYLSPLDVISFIREYSGE